MTIKEILRTFSFRERSMNSMHIFKHFWGYRLSILIIFKSAFLWCFIISISVRCWLIIIYFVIIMWILIVDMLHNGWEVILMRILDLAVKLRNLISAHLLRKNLITLIAQISNCLNGIFLSSNCIFCASMKSCVHSILSLVRILCIKRVQLWLNMAKMHIIYYIWTSACN